LEIKQKWGRKGKGREEVVKLAAIHDEDE